MNEKDKEVIKNYLLRIKNIQKSSIQTILSTAKKDQKEYDGKDRDSSEETKESAELDELKRDKEQHRELREKYANKSFYFMSIWSVILWVFLFIFLFFCPKNLTPWVLVTLIGSTTINLFQLFSIIIKGLFQNNNHFDI